MKKIITISTGTELMLGYVMDQDFGFMAKEFSKIGCPVYRHYTVGDDFKELQKVFAEALFLSDIVVLSGGLGPTTDDLTREVVSSVLKRPLEMNKTVLKDLKRKFHKRGLEVPLSNEKQALVLKGAKVISNHFGTAPGMYIQEKKKKIFLLPGPPFELNPMFERNVKAVIQAAIKKDRLRFISFRTFGIRESDVQERMSKIFKDAPKFLNGLGYTSSPHGVDVRVAGKERSWDKLFSFIQRLEKDLKEWIYGLNRESMEEIVAKLLFQKNKTLAIAESCTGGLLAQRLTSISGISKVFKLGVVSYSNEAKQNILGVRSKTLQKFGAVSQEVASEMALGVRKKARSDFGVSITGIAGPTGGSPEKPVGLVWIGLTDGKKTYVQEHHFLGSRDVIQFKASQAALDMLRRLLLHQNRANQEII